MRTVHEWDHIKSALPSNTKGSWIIVTTRNEAVPNAYGSSSQCFVYNISPLTPKLVEQVVLQKSISWPRRYLSSRPCFSYLPEDYDVERKRLVRRWVAEGLVSGSRGMFAEEATEGCFLELISRRLIQPSKITGDGKVKTCPVHDIMLEIIDSITSVDNLVRLVD
ncbi:hypothetical protein GW17_00045438 [Ensete ventricosum]|nr:hypothetical protein GW17_00045438 [Ensete ventricosum]